MLLHVDSKPTEELFDFNPPKKTSTGVYEAALSKPIKFKLPEMDLLDSEQDTDGFVYKYLIDLENQKCAKLLKFLYSLDTAAIDAAQKHSQSWFKRTLSRTAIEQKYIPPYNTDAHDNLFLKLKVSPSVYASFSSINLEQPHYAVMNIEGLEFYKKNFLFSLSVVKFVQLKKNGINAEIINNLADYHDSEDSEDDVIMYRNMENPLDTKISKFEIESIVDQKKRELDQYFVEAEKASRYLETIRLKVIQKSNELKNIESLLESDCNCE